MGYFYAIMWFIVGLILIFSISKENKIFYFAGGFFILLGGWWLADTLMPDNDLFAGGWGVALRVITITALVVLSIFFMMERNRNIKREMMKQKMSEEKEED